MPHAAVEWWSGLPRSSRSSLAHFGTGRTLHPDYISTGGRHFLRGLLIAEKCEDWDDAESGLNWRSVAAAVWGWSRHSAHIFNDLGWFAKWRIFNCRLDRRSLWRVGFDCFCVCCRLTTTSVLNHTMTWTTWSDRDQSMHTSWALANRWRPGRRDQVHQTYYGRYWRTAKTGPVTRLS